MATPVSPHQWKKIEFLSGYILRRADVQGRRIGDLPGILGMDEEYIKDAPGAMYGIMRVSDHIMRSMTNVGFNNDRDPKNPDSFYRPPLMAGEMNASFGIDPSLAAEIEILYMQRGMLVKFKFPENKSARKTTQERFPKGAGIREYVLHRPTPFQLIWDFQGSDTDKLIP